MAAPALLRDEIHQRYGLYTKLHEARTLDPETFTIQFSNTVLWSILGGRRVYGWRVVGITKAALQSYKDHDFSVRAQKASGMNRGHLHRRIDTTAKVLNCPKPMLVEELAETLWQLDRTVVCVRGENHLLGTLGVTEISFENDECKWFRGKQVGWQFGENEKALLRILAGQYL